MKTRIGINGFGRIGRNFFKAVLNNYSDKLEVVAINDLTDSKTLAHLLKYDSLYGKFSEKIEATENSLIVNGNEIQIIKERNPANIDWKKYNIKIVIESTGLFTNRDYAELHITKGGAKKVIITAPATKEDITVVLGVNNDKYITSKHNIISNASCTTNCLAPIAKIINDNLKIKRGFMSTIHSYTNDQRILDLPHHDLRRARAAAMSIIPTKTGAAKAIGLVIPELLGKVNGISYRVPTSTVSLVDFVVETEKSASKEQVNMILKEASQNELKGVLKYSEEPLVSVDYKGDPASSIIDSLSTMEIGRNLFKIVSWYDNEWGYSNRCADLANFITCKGL